MARYLEVCTPGPRSKQTRSMKHFLQSNYCFIGGGGGRKTEMTQLGRKQLLYKNVRVQIIIIIIIIITLRGTGRGLLSESHSFKEQRGLPSLEARRLFDNLHLPIAPAQ
jgi:hypothetical protein